MFRSECLDHRVAGNRIGQRPAHLRIRIVRKPVCWSHPRQRHPYADADEQRNGNREVKPHHGLAQKHPDRQRDEQDQRRAELHDHDVGKVVVGPHAPRDLAHRGPRERVRMPVRTEPLQRAETIHDYHLHGFGGEVHPHPKVRLLHQGYEGQDSKQPESRAPGLRKGRGTFLDVQHRGHQFRGPVGNLDFEQDAYHHAGKDQGELRRLLPPVAPDKKKNLGKRDRSVEHGSLSSANMPSRRKDPPQGGWRNEAGDNDLMVPEVKAEYANFAHRFADSRHFRTIEPNSDQKRVV